MVRGDVSHKWLQWGSRWLLDKEYGRGSLMWKVAGEVTSQW